MLGTVPTCCSTADSTQDALLFGHPPGHRDGIIAGYLMRAYGKDREQSLTIAPDSMIWIRTSDTPRTVMISFKMSVRSTGGTKLAPSP